MRSGVQRLHAPGPPSLPPRRLSPYERHALRPRIRISSHRISRAFKYYLRGFGLALPLTFRKGAEGTLGRSRTEDVFAWGKLKLLLENGAMPSPELMAIVGSYGAYQYGTELDTWRGAPTECAAACPSGARHHA